VTTKQPLVQAPAWGGIVGAEYTTEIGGLRVAGGGDVSFRSKLWARQPSTPRTATDPLYLLPGVQRLNAHFTVSSADDSWSVSLIGRNLTDKYILETDYSATGYTGAAVIPERPRTVALQLNYKI
jgi:iron complex outermembrane receptor protein